VIPVADRLVVNKTLFLWFGDDMHNLNQEIQTGSYNLRDQRSNDSDWKLQPQRSEVMIQTGNYNLRDQKS
jgi:hypothetical protein